MIIAPSLLAANFGRFAKEAERITNAGADWLHLDIMDGHFVPNISFGPQVVKTLRPVSRIFFDVHLMCSKPEILLAPFAEAGANQITVHVELGEQAVTQLLWKIKSLGLKAGLAVNPPTSVALVKPHLEQTDTLLIMTVNPGFGGQSFIHETLPKIQQAAAWRRELSLGYHIEVDGGINFATAAECARVGADTFVSGTALLSNRSLGAAVKKMRKIVEGASLAGADARVPAGAGLLLVNPDIQFGTDGWRAIIADTFTFDNVARVAQASADYWAANPVVGAERRVVVGYDRRFLSERFAKVTAEVFAGNDFEVVLTPQPTPTPAVSFAVKRLRAIGGVVITASHNPPQFNGFKLKSHYGGPAMPETCQAVEAMLDQHPVHRMDLNEVVKAGHTKIRDLNPAHHAALKRLVDFKLISQSRLRFAHDALFGVGAGCFEKLLAGTTCRVTTLNGQHDPLFGGINPEPVRQNYRLSSDWLRKHPHDVCLVTDGDADRVGGMDGRGGFISTHEIIALLLHHYIANRGETGRVIKAMTTTSLIDKICAAHGLPMEEVPVGFKHISAEMVKGGVMLGAEESGGIGFGGHIPERDGIAAGLMLLELLAMERKPLRWLLAQLQRKFGPHCYDRTDIQFPLELRPALMTWLAANPPAHLDKSPVTAVHTQDGVKFVAADSSWLMLRGSGTEPVLRIYAETRTVVGVRRLLCDGLKMTERVRQQERQVRAVRGNSRG